MRRAFGFLRELTLLTTLVLALYSSAACSGSTAATGAPGASGGAEAATSAAANTGTSGGADAPFGIVIQETYVTIENHTGMPIVGGEVAIISGGVRPPYTMSLPRLENKRKRDFPLRSFRGNDG